MEQQLRTYARPLRAKRRSERSRPVARAGVKRASALSLPGDQDLGETALSHESSEPDAEDLGDRPLTQVIRGHEEARGGRLIIDRHRRPNRAIVVIDEEEPKLAAMSLVQHGREVRDQARVVGQSGGIDRCVHTDQSALAHRPVEPKSSICG